MAISRPILKGVAAVLIVAGIVGGPQFVTPTETLRSACSLMSLGAGFCILSFSGFRHFEPYPDSAPPLSAFLAGCLGLLFLVLSAIRFHAWTQLV